MEKPCKEWTGARFPKGYGAIRYKGATWRVHRAEWDKEKGRIPEGALVLHHCDNPSCYEITHLYLGSAADNTRDMLKRGRQAPRSKLPLAKLTNEQAAEIMARYASGGVTQVQLAAEYGVTQGAISFIVKGRKTGKRRRTPEEVAAIRAAVAAGASQKSIAEQFGIHQSSVSEIVRGLTHRSAAS